MTLGGICAPGDGGNPVLAGKLLVGFSQGVRLVAKATLLPPLGVPVEEVGQVRASHVLLGERVWQ